MSKRAVPGGRPPAEAQRGGPGGRPAAEAQRGGPRGRPPAEAQYISRPPAEARYTGWATRGRQAATQPRQAARPSLVTRAQRLSGEWGPTAARVMLGLVLAWFGYHELVQPRLWTGYVPGVSPSSTFAILLVLAHGWALLILAVAITAGVALRLAAAVAAVLLLQIVITLTITGGLTDLTLRDVGVLGLAVCLTGNARQRFTLTG